MSGDTTKKMLREYVEAAPAPNFLAGFYESPPENYHTSENVEFDVERDGEDVAIVVQHLSAGARQNESTLYTNKEFTPPVYKEQATIPAYRLLGRDAGANPYAEMNYDEKLVRRTLSVFRKMEKKLYRAVEVQASQVLQTGKLDLVDAAGTTVYDVDFKPKSSHFPQANNTWGGGSDTPLKDLEALADVILQDGKTEASRIILGRKALLAFLADATVHKLLDTRRANLGSIGRPEVRGAGGKYHGDISVGQWTFEIWSYTGFYLHPQTGAVTKYVGDDNVIMLGDGRLDLTYGAVPRIGRPEGQVLRFLPPRMSNAGVSFDVHPNAWVELDGEAITLSVSARPMCIPTAIDTYGCLNTDAT